MDTGKVTRRDYFLFQKLLLKWVGLSVSEKKSPIYRAYSTFALCLTFFTVLTTSSEILVNKGDLDLTINALIYVAGASMATGKFLTLYLYNKQFGILLNSIQQGMFAPNYNRGGPIERILIEKCITNGTRQTLIYSGLVFTVWGICLIATLIKRIISKDAEDWNLPFASFSLFDVTRSPNFEIVWLYQGIAYIMHSVTFFIVDVIFANFTSHISVQFKILKNYIGRIGVKGYSYPEIQAGLGAPKIPWNEIKNVQRDIIVHHNSIINVSKQFERICSMYLFCNHFGTFFITCSVLYHLTVLNELDFRLIKDLFVFTFVTLNTLILSYWSDDVIMESESVGDACWEANFTETDVKFQKGLALIIQRSQRPVVFTVGKLAPLTEMTSVAMLRTAVSYFMILRSFKVRESEN